jgi:hypothetical protein
VSLLCHNLSRWFVLVSFLDCLRWLEDGYIPSLFSIWFL